MFGQMPKSVYYLIAIFAIIYFVNLGIVMATDGLYSLETIVGPVVNTLDMYNGHN